MITDQGQIQKLKLLAGKASKFADVFAVGISNAVLPTSATALDFAWATANITDAYVDEDLQQVIFYGTLPPEIAGDIKEIGLISLSDEFVQTGLPNALVYGFTVAENWFSDGTFTITNESSVGTESYRFDNITVNKYLAKGVDGINMSRYDTVKLKVESLDVSQIRIILKNDDTNYAYKNIALVDGENLSDHTLSSFVTVGTFNPQLINEVRLMIETVDNATNFIEFDALSICSEINGGLVARSILATPQYKRTGAGMEIEYAVAL